MSDSTDTPPPPPQKLVQRPRRLARDAQKEEPPAPAPAVEEDDLEPIREPPMQFDLPTGTKANTTPRYPSKKLETLEDIYATFRAIGDGTTRLRIERIAPRNWGGQLIAGYLCYVDERITMDDFVERFGGGRYEVGVIGPVGTADETGVQPTKQITSIEVSVPGLPNLYPAGEDIMQQQQPRPGYSMPLTEHPTVQRARLDHEYKDREREREMVAKANTTPEHVVNAFKETSKEAIADIKDMAAASNAILREQNQGYVQQIVKLNDELKELRNESVALRAKADSAAREAEVKTEKQMREAHEGLLKSLTEAHRKEIESLKEQHRAALDNLEKSSRATIDSLNAAHGKELSHERDRHRESMDSAQRSYRDDLTRRDADASAARTLLKEQADNRIKDLEKSYDRELAAVRDERNKTVDSIKAQYDNTKEVTKQGSEMRIQLAETEAGRLRAQVEKLEKDLERVRKESTKTPMEFLQEAEAVSRGMLGMVRADEIETGDKEEKFDWKTEAAKAAIGAVSKIPEAVERAAAGIAQVRERNAAVHAEAQMAAQQQQRPALGGARPARQRRGAPPPEPWVDANGVPPPYVGPIVGAEVPFQHPYAPIPRAPEPGAQPAAVQAQAPVQAAPVQAQAAPPVQVSNGAPTSAPALTPEQEAEMQNGYIQFVTALEQHIRGKVTPPTLFAQQFVATVGTEQTAIFLKQNSADGFLAHIEKSLPEGENTPILTRDGRAFVKSLWIEVAKIVAAAQGQEGAAP